MDLTIVAQMIQNGEYPDLSHLQQQQYNLMAQDADNNPTQEVATISGEGGASSAASSSSRQPNQ